MAIDYETEYDNRARVPEHPEIFARWQNETDAYRAGAPGAQLGLSYGPSPRQTIDWFPGQNAGPDSPLALFIHGGWWRSLSPTMFSQMAKGPNAHGVTAAVAGYDLAPTVSIATVIDQMRAVCLHLWRNHNKRIFVYGHSAGGHLTACMVATDWKALDPSAPADLVPAGYSISGVFDLAPLTQVSQNADLKLTDESARASSPLFWPVPAGRTLDLSVKPAGTTSRKPSPPDFGGGLVMRETVDLSSKTVPKPEPPAPRAGSPTSAPPSARSEPRPRRDAPRGGRDDSRGRGGRDDSRGRDSGQDRSKGEAPTSSSSSLADLLDPDVLAKLRGGGG